jgi:hypothetical protein
MSGNFTRRKYDTCANVQYTKSSTDPMNFNLDPVKYINCNNICQPLGIPNGNKSYYAPVDVESSLWGIDRRSSDCNSFKYPFCADKGCLITQNPLIAPHITPFACERGRYDEKNKAVIKTNMRPYQDSGIRVPNSRCSVKNTNGYYINSSSNLKL